jgi:hypothetical protein
MWMRELGNGARFQVEPFAELERDRIRERIMAGLQRAQTQGNRLGRPKRAVPVDRLATVASLSLTEAATASMSPAQRSSGGVGAEKTLSAAA